MFYLSLFFLLATLAGNFFIASQDIRSLWTGVFGALTLVAFILQFTRKKKSASNSQILKKSHPKAQAEKIQQLSQEKDKLNAILQGMREGILVTNETGIITLANPSFYRVFNLETRVEGKSVLESLRNPEIFEILKRVIQEQTALEKEIDFQIHGEEKCILVHLSPLITASKSSGATLVFFDLTQIRRLERTRRDFVANVSHELKTPLTSIRGFAETLRGGASQDPKLFGRFLEKIENNALLLQNLIEDLLKISEIESGRKDWNPEKVEVEPILEEIHQFFTDSLEKNNIQLKIMVPPALEVETEPPAFKQILVNLIGNAIKYTQEGGSIELKAQTEGPWVRFSVQDTGMGIPKKELPQIFERLYRVDKARSREMGGTGLGLAIVKHLVQSHGGEVQVESEEGRGTCFSFTLPRSNGTVLPQ